jgi:hypothetical protein
LGGNRDDAFTFGIKAEAAAPISIDVHDRVSVITGGTIPFAVYISNQNIGTFGVIPLLVRMGVEIKAANHVSPFFLFELGPGIAVGGGTADVSFAWRIWVGTSFWGVIGKEPRVPYGQTMTVSWSCCWKGACRGFGAGSSSRRRPQFSQRTLVQFSSRAPGALASMALIQSTTGGTPPVVSSYTLSLPNIVWREPVPK